METELHLESSVELAQEICPEREIRDWCWRFALVIHNRREELALSFEEFVSRVYGHHAETITGLELNEIRRQLIGQEFAEKCAESLFESIGEVLRFPEMYPGEGYSPVVALFHAANDVTREDSDAALDSVFGQVCAELALGGYKSPANR